MAKRNGGTVTTAAPAKQNDTEHKTLWTPNSGVAMLSPIHLTHIRLPLPALFPFPHLFFILSYLHFFIYLKDERCLRIKNPWSSLHIIGVEWLTFLVVVSHFRKSKVWCLSVVAVSVLIGRRNRQNNKICRRFPTHVIKKKDLLYFCLFLVLLVNLILRLLSTYIFSLIPWYHISYDNLKILSRRKDMKNPMPFK